MDRLAILRQAQLALARRDFFYYCQLMAGDFYKTDRTYLKQLCDSFQGFMSDDEHNVLVVNIGPRHGKSRTAGMFVQWRNSTQNDAKTAALHVR